MNRNARTNTGKTIAPVTPWDPGTTNLDSKTSPEIYKSEQKNTRKSIRHASPISSIE
jgi:hypothetical protein